MTKLIYYIPHAIWIIVAIFLIENSLIDNRYRFYTFVIFSFIVALILEILRNRMLNNYFTLSRTRIILYIFLNILIGIPFNTIVILAIIPLGFIIFDDSVVYESWQLYLGIGYLVVWFLINTIILKPSNIISILMLLLSPILMEVSSLIIGLIIGSIIGLI